MIRRIILASALALGLGAAAVPAQAGTDVDIVINLGFGGFYGRNISCAKGRAIVEQRFNAVMVRECGGKNFTYAGRRNGKGYIVKVSASTGRIVDVTRWWR